MVKFLTIDDGTFILSETENENQFLFYRIDGKTLKGVDKEPIALYEAYVVLKMLNGYIKSDITSHIFQEDISDDGKFIQLTVINID